MTQSHTVVTRDMIVAAARAWIGTPYIHQASVMGAGTDCLGLVRGVYRAVIGHEPEVPPPYGPDWNHSQPGEPLLEAARRHLIEISVAEAKTGDVVLFRVLRAGPAKHLAILSDAGRMVHAHSGLAVAEVAAGPWMNRAAAAFRFPGIED